MESIWMGIAPGLRDTRVIAMHGASETILNVDFAPFEAPRARKPAAGEGRMIAGKGAERSPAG